MIKLIKATVITIVLSLTAIYANSNQSNDKNSHEGHNHAQNEHKHESHNNIHKEDSHKAHGHSCRYTDIKNEVSKETIEKAAKQKIQSLVAEKKIPKNWKNIPISKIGKTHYGDTDDWVVGFDNIKIKNKERQTLYIFVSVHGEIRGANYTGN